MPDDSSNAKPFEHPQHLVAWVSGRDEPLVDERIRQTDRKTPIWECCSDEVWTPGSLPLRIAITLGLKNDLQVWTATTQLLDAWLVDVNVHVSLLLPTDETLTIQVEERRG